VCRIRKLGYPVRRVFLEFYKRYRCIDLLCPDLDSLLNSLTNKRLLKQGEWAKGNTRVFMRTAQSQELEIAREASLTDIAVLLQKNGRKMVAVRKYKYFKKIITDLQSAISQREESLLASVLDLSFELPSNGSHLQVVKNAKILLARIKEEKRVSKLLENAIATRDINTLKNALLVHGEMNPSFTTPLAHDAATLLARLEEELRIREALTVAIAVRDRAKLSELVDRAKSMDYSCNEVSQAEAVIVRLDQEAELLRKLKEAIAKENLDELNIIFSECAAQGLETYYKTDMENAKRVHAILLEREIAKEAERKRREEEEERQRKALAEIEARRQAQIAAARTALQEAMSKRNIDQINKALQQAIQNGVQIKEVDEARELVEHLKNLESIKAQLIAAIQVLSTKADTGITNMDLQPLSHAISLAEPVSYLFCYNDQIFQLLLSGREVERCIFGIHTCCGEVRFVFEACESQK
jgi:myosin heavy subunit